MKRDRQSVNERHRQILALLRERHEIKVDELADYFGVSLMTIRRDLQSLEDRGLISRFYGGAAVGEATDAGSPDGEIRTYRSLIERYAASLVTSGDTLFINGSTTAIGMLSCLGDKEVTVFTNSTLPAGQKLPRGVAVTISGGTISGATGILTGDCAMRNLLEEYASKAFLGCTGISPSGEVLCDIPMELSINETMIAHSDEYFILLDHTKVGVSSNYASFHLDRMGTVITDELAPADVIEQLRLIGMTVIQIGKDGVL